VFPRQKVAAVDGVTENAASTEAMSIDLLNSSTIGAEVEMQVAACAGFGWSQRDPAVASAIWAMKIFAVMLGTVICGVMLVRAETMMVFVSVEQVDEHATGRIMVDRLLSVWVELEVFEDDEDLFIAEDAGIGKQAGPPGVFPAIVVHAAAQRL